MVRNRPWIVDLLWLAVVLLLVSLHFWFPDVGSGQASDTFSTTAEGKKAFYRLVRRRAIFAKRILDPLSVLLSRLGEGETVCLLGLARYPTADEWDRLLGWVASGGQLVVAARLDEPELAIDRLGIEVQPYAGASGSAPAGSARDLRTELLQVDALTWESNGRIVASDALSGEGPYEPLVEHRNSIQAVVCEHGAGRVVIVASDFIFSNRALAAGENSVLSFRLLEAVGRPDFVHFDESLNVSGTPKVVGLLFDPFLRPLTVQLLIGLAIFGWWHSRRFGPLLPASTRPRHNIVDHTDAVGLLYYRSREGGAALRPYLQHTWSELRLDTFKGQEQRVVEPIAAALGKSPRSVMRALRRARQSALARRLERGQAAKMIRNLAIIRCSARRTRTPTRRKGRRQPVSGE